MAELAGRKILLTGGLGTPGRIGVSEDKKERGPDDLRVTRTEADQDPASSAECTCSVWSFRAVPRPLRVLAV